MSIPRDLDWIQYSFLLAGERVELSSELRQYRKLSGADFKYMGSGFGEDVVINPRPQFTPFADIRRPGLWAGGSTSIKTPENISSYFVGMGRAYSDMFHDNRQVVHIRFGVTQYKGLLTFFTGFYDQSAAILARQGRASIAYYFGYVAGSLATLWLAPFVLAGQAVKYLLGRNSSSYMSLKPAMPLYWLRANTIMNNIGANLGIIARTFENTGLYDGKKEVLDAQGKPVSTAGVNDLADLNDAQNSQYYKESMYRLMPDIWDRNGQLDLQKAVNQGIRKQREHNNRVNEQANKLGANTATSVFKTIIAELNKPITGTKYPAMATAEYVKLYHGGVLGSIKDKNLDSDNVGDAVQAKIDAGDADGLKKLASDASATEGGNAAVADGTGDAGAGAPELAAATEGNVEPAPTATAESQAIAEAAGVNTGVSSTEIGAMLKKAKATEMLTTTRPKETAEATDQEKLAQQAESAEGQDKNYFSKKFDILQGWMSSFSDELENEWNRGSAFLNLEINYTGAGSMNLSNSSKETTISGTMKGVSGAARDTRISASDFKTGFGFVDAGMQMMQDLFTGGLDAVKMSGLMALAGNAFTVFPKQWDDSTVSVPTANFTIELRSFTGNDIHNYMTLYPTIACLLAGAVCPSTGPQSYTAPFVLEAYSRGAFAIRYGMISSLTIRHGVGNLGYNDNRRPIAFEIDVELADLTGFYHTSISNGASPINIFKRVFDDDNSFNDYISTITGLSIDDMVDPRRKFSLNMAKQMANVRSWWSPSQVSSRLVNSTPITVLNKIFGPSTFPGMK